MHVQAANVNNAGQGYQVGDILTRNTGGTFTINPTFEVRSVDAGGGILTVNVLEPGDCSVAPTGSIGVTGGSGRSEERRVGKEWSVRVDLGVRRIIKKKKV